MRFLLNLFAAFLGVLAAFFFLFILLFLFVALQDTTPTVADRSILVVDLQGPIPETEPIDPFTELFTSSKPTLRDVTEALERAGTDDRIAGVWLQAPGTAVSWATALELRTALETYRTSGKPLVASAGPEGFSELSYYLATAADSVFSTPEATFELNGLYLSVPFFAGTLDKLGVDPVVIRAGAYKSAAETLTERGFSPENREQYAELLAAFDEQFRVAVATSRRLSRAELDRTIEEGGIYMADAAFQLGLLDGLRYQRDTEAALRDLTEQEPDRALRTVSMDDYVRATRDDRRGGSDRIALVYATGTIMPGESGSDGGGGATLGSETFVEAVEEALRDDRTRALVLRVDSPGGSATASDEMWAAVRDAAVQMPVVVSMGSVAASGGYYIAAPAHAIVAEPTTITGSIGVISVLFNAREFLNDRLGITVDTLRTGPAAGLFDLSRAPAPLERQALEGLTENIYTTFVQRVADGRGISTDSVRALGGGRVYTGERALEVGLVDELGGLQHAVRLAAERAGLEPDDYRLRVLPIRKPLMERLQETLSAQAMLAWFHERSMSVEERQIRQQALLLQQAATLRGTPQTRLFEVPEVR